MQISVFRQMVRGQGYETVKRRQDCSGAGQRTIYDITLQGRVVYSLDSAYVTRARAVEALRLQLAGRETAVQAERVALLDEAGCSVWRLDAVMPGDFTYSLSVPSHRLYAVISPPPRPLRPRAVRLYLCGGEKRGRQRPGNARVLATGREETQGPPAGGAGALPRGPGGLSRAPREGVTLLRGESGYRPSPSCGSTRYQKARSMERSTGRAFWYHNIHGGRMIYEER